MINYAAVLRGRSAKCLRLAMTGAAILAASSVAVSAEALKFGSFIPAQADEMKSGIIPWMEEVEKASDGEITFQKFFGGALSGSPVKQFELLENGIQDATIVVTSYVHAVFPDFSLFATPYLGLKNAEESSVALWRLSQTGMLRGLDRLHVVSVYTNDNSRLHTRKEISSLDDLKGMKIRAAGPTESSISSVIGATGVGMPINQVAQSLNTGVIDAAMQTWGSLRAFRLESLVRSSIEDELGARTFIVAINKDVYEGLSDKAKKVLAETGGEKLARHMGQVFDKQSADVRAKAMAARPESIVSFNDAEKVERAKLYQPVRDQWMEGNEQGEALLAKLNEIVAEMRAETKPVQASE